MGDRVALQQVLMNLMVNSIDAMMDVNGEREIFINSQRAEDEQLVVSVSDTAVGLRPQQAGHMRFFTTKPHDTGMGLRISALSLSLTVDGLLAAPSSPRGARFYFMLSVNAEGPQ
jgi:C4-dicarboxylate-specific signal transduction histidine kinase